MSDKPKQDDSHNFDPENLMVNIGGRLVPWNKVNKPHHAVLNPEQHKPQLNAEDFPDIEPEAKEREAKRAEEMGKKTE